MNGGSGTAARDLGSSMKSWFGLSLAAHLCGATLVAALVPNFRTIPDKEVYVVEFSRLDAAAGTRQNLAAAVAKPPAKQPREKAMPPAATKAASIPPHQTLPPVLATPAIPAPAATVAAHTVAAHDASRDNDSASPPVALRGGGALSPGGHPPSAIVASAESASGEAKATLGPQKVSDIVFGSASGPAFLYRSLPVYPHQARRFGREGKVLLRLTIDESGALIHTEVIEDPGYGFAAAAIEALKKSRFSPARRNGRPIMVKTILPVRFELQRNN